MRYITNTFGKMKLVTFKEFLKEVPCKILDYQYPFYGFHARFRPTKESEDSPFVYPEYKTITIPLLKGDPESILRGQLFSQSEYDLIRGRIPVLDVFWCLSGRHAKDGGSPTHLVRISRRIWLAADIREFLIVKNNNGIGLSCKQPMRTCLTTVEKRTCSYCNGTGEVDSGGVTSWGAGINIQCPNC